MVRQVTLLAGGKISSYQPVRIAARARRVLTRWLLFNSLEGLGMILLWFLNLLTKEL